MYSYLYLPSIKLRHYGCLIKAAVMACVVFIGGPSGTGKSTVSQELVSQLSKTVKCCLIEGDEWHSLANIEKMSNNIPLTDEDRWPWLKKLAQLASLNAKDYEVVVIACSMLKKSYRDLLKSELANDKNITKLSLFLLCNTYENVLRQMKQRKNHFFKESMLRSQYDTFEKPDESVESGVYILHCDHKTQRELADEIRGKL